MGCSTVFSSQRSGQFRSRCAAKRFVLRRGLARQRCTSDLARLPRAFALWSPAPGNSRRSMPQPRTARTARRFAPAQALLPASGTSTRPAGSRPSSRPPQCLPPVNLQRIDFRDQQPEDRTQADRERSDIRHQRDHRYAGQPAARRQERKTKDAQSDDNSRRSDPQQWPAPHPVNQPHRNKRHQHVHDANARCRKNGAGSRRNARGLQNRRRIVDHRVNSGDLLKNGQSDADNQRGTNRGAKKVGPVTALARLSERVPYFLEFGRNVRAASNSLENFQRLVRLAMLRQPSRASRKVQQAQPQHYSRNGGKTKHPSPPSSPGESVINHVCSKNSDRDGELEQRDLPPARFGRRNF